MLHILKASGRLAQYETVIMETAEAALYDIQKKIHLPSVDIVFEDNPNEAILNHASGGICPNPHLVRVAINPEYENINVELSADLRSTLAHELHHAARANVVGYGDTLREALVTEGLAAHFDIELHGGEPKPWDVEVTGRELEQMKQLAIKEIDDENHNHARWFFGAGDGEIPYWTGYSLAFNLVGKYLDQTGKTAGELVDTPAEEFSIDKL